MFHTTIRFTNASSTNAYSITYNNLMDLIFWPYDIVSVVTGYRLVTAARIRKVEIFGPCTTAASTANKIQFQWVGGSANFSNPSLLVEDIALGNSSHNSHIVAVPPPNTVAHMWFQGSTNIAFQMDVPQGSVIELTMDFSLSDVKTGSSIATSTTCVGVTGSLANVVACKSLDGAGKLLATGWNSVA